MVVQLTGVFFVSWSDEYRAAAAANSLQTWIRAADRKLCVSYMTIRPAVV